MIFNPAFSNLAFIKPVKFRFVASGLIIDNVFSIGITFSDVINNKVSICIIFNNQ